MKNWNVGKMEHGLRSKNTDLNKLEIYLCIFKGKIKKLCTFVTEIRHTVSRTHEELFFLILWVCNDALNMYDDQQVFVSL